MFDKKKVNVVPEFMGADKFKQTNGVLTEPSSFQKLVVGLSPKLEIDHARSEFIRKLAESGPIVYAIRNRNIYDLQIIRMRFAELGLSVPAFAFNLSPYEAGSPGKYFRILGHKFKSFFKSQKLQEPVNSEIICEIMKNGGAPVFFLVDEKTSRDRYLNPEQDPIRILSNLQSTMSASIAVVPMFIISERKLRKSEPSMLEQIFGDPDDPGLLRRLFFAVRQWTVPELLIGDPVYLVGEFEEFGADVDWEEMPFKVRQELTERVNNKIRVNRGPVPLSRTEIKERVLQDPRVQKAVSSGEGDREQEGRKKAEAYVDEIAANPMGQVHHILYYVLKGLFAKIFDGVDSRSDQFSMLKQTNSNGSLIFISTHRSHFDYLIIGYLCFINHMAIPLMAAGQNLAFWPVGPTLRNCAAFFMRRTFRGLSLYTSVFAAYLKVLVQEKYNINFYIEGGRSRTGKLLQPKLGMLSLILETIENGDVDDLSFIPTYMAYEENPEEKSYLRELAGREKQKESFGQFVQARSVLKKRYGKAYIRFHEPITLDAFCKLAGITKDEFFAKDKRKWIHEFAYYTMSLVAKTGIVTPGELAAASILATGRSRSRVTEVEENSHFLLLALKHENIELDSRLAHNPSIGLTDALSTFKRRDLIEGGDKALPEFIIAPHKAKPTLFFLKNSLANFLWSESLISTAILTSANRDVENVRDTYRQAKTLLSKEVIWNPFEWDTTQFDSIMRFFADKKWMDMTDANITILNPKPLICFASIFYDIVVAYVWTLNRMDVLGSPVSTRELSKELIKYSQEIQKDSQEILPIAQTVTINQALSRFGEMGIIEFKESKKSIGAVINNALKLETLEFLNNLMKFREYR